MSKIYVPFPEDKYVDFYLEHNIDGFFLGIEKFSINFNNYIKIDDIKDSVKKVNNRNKEVYIVLNNLYYEKDINSLKKILKTVSKYNIDGIFYQDPSIYNIVNEEKLDIKLYLDYIHIGTNYKTINFWEKRGVKGALLSTEITLDEILEIKERTSSFIGIKLYGYLNMVISSRTLVTNYLKHIKLNKESIKYNIKENNELYPINEENIETSIFSSKVLNAIEYFPKIIKNNIDYVFLDDYMIEKNNFYNVVEAFCALTKAPNDKEFIHKLKDVVDVNTQCETFDGFFNKKTIYKVKNNEKS